MEKTAPSWSLRSDWLGGTSSINASFSLLFYVGATSGNLFGHLVLLSLPSEPHSPKPKVIDEASFVLNTR